MTFFILVLSCVIAGSLACSNSHCKDRSLAIELMQVGFLPNKEELRTLCPKVMTFFECEKDAMVCNGQSLEELANSSDEEKKKEAKRLLVAIDLVRDLCNEDTDIHNDYVASVSCYREYFTGASSNCRNVAMKPVEEFFDQLYGNETDVSEEVHYEMRCLKDAFEMACIIDNLGDTCGAVAQRAARNAVQRAKGLLGYGGCDNVKNSASLKSRFLDYLELDEQKKNSVQGIFDLFKRRR